MFREQIKIVDCTIRDGGLMNDWYFPDDLVRDVYVGLNQAGVDYMEIGYRASKRLFSPEKFGPWRFCDDDHVARLLDGIERRTKLSIMVDVDRVDLDQILPAEQSVIDMVRVATYVPDIDKAIYLANDAHEKGYETTINVMAISRAIETELDEALAQIEEESHVAAAYLVDSFGALYSEQIHFLTDKFRSFLKTRETGVHCHNNQQLAYANTIEGIIHNANFVDGTIYGIGRAAGNCPLELLIAFLKNPKFNVRPVLGLISKHFMAMQQELKWGYHIPYMITGVLNEHPRSAMAVMKGGNLNNFVDFFEQIAGDPELA
ncbi:MAG: aldolase catalytic domain-containing protein [Planctomycetota bacterium]